jgi:aminobenzoyl-glutamate utilization protein B
MLRCPTARARWVATLAACALVAALAALPARPAGAAEEGSRAKRRAVESIDARRGDLVRLSQEIWAYAETALRETRSAKALADYAERQGFKVERGVAGMPTAFVATYGGGRPIIGILGEYDALPGISQKAAPVREPLEPGAAGHGCGHNLFGAGSLGAALAIKERIAAGDLKGTVRFYGTPAEESLDGKVFMVRDGLFKDLDVCLAWHPGDRTEASLDSSQAMVDLRIDFRGRTAHAAADPWNGRSALDGLEAFTHGINLLREHVRPSVRLHYVIEDGGDVPNVIPDRTRLRLWVRDTTRKGVDTVLERVRDIGRGSGLIAGVETGIQVQSGVYELLVLRAGAELLHANLAWLGPLSYTDEEQAFARLLQKNSGVEEKGVDGSIQPFKDPKPDPPGGSTDVGDVSWVVPTLHLSVTTAPWEIPWHAWPAVASSGTSIGHKGMIHAAKVLAATAVDLIEKPDLLARIRAEFADRTKGQVYRPYIPEGPPPLPAR